MVRKFKLPPGIVIPRDAFQIKTPIEDSNLRVFSDLFPTACITATFPEIGVSLYGEIERGNCPDDSPFLGYVLKRMEPEGRDFTRLFFVPVISETDKLTPLPGTTKTVIDDMDWPHVMLFARFEKNEVRTQNSSYANSEIQGGEEGTALIPTWNAKVGWIEGGTYQTRVTKKVYAASTSWNLQNAEIFEPMPTPIRWSLPGTSASYPKCLHPEIRIPAEPQSYPVVYESGMIQVANGTEGLDEVYPQTNMTQWIPYIVRRQVENVDGLEVLTVFIAEPPVQPKPQILTP